MQNNIRIRFKLQGGQYTYWLSPEEVARYRNEHIEYAIVEERMSYEQAMKVLKEKKNG